MSLRARPLALASLASLSIVIGVASAGCDEQKLAPSTTSSAPTATPPPATSSAPVASAVTSATAAPIASATALPSADPTSVHTTPPAAPSAGPDAGARDAGPKPKPTSSAAIDAGATVDAGTKDAGATAALDASAPVSQALATAQKIDAIFAAKPTFSARFKQQYTMHTTGEPKDSTGTVMIERPNKLSFRYDPPKRDRVVSDGVTIKIYQAEEQQMIELPAQKTAYPGAFAFLLGNGISTSFDFAINAKANWSGGVVLDGRPLTPNPSYELVMFYVDSAALAASDPGALKRVLVVDAQKNKNRFDFEGVTQPPSIPAAEFTFTPPAGTTIKK